MLNVVSALLAPCDPSANTSSSIPATRRPLPAEPRYSRRCALPGHLPGRIPGRGLRGWTPYRSQLAQVGEHGVVWWDPSQLGRQEIRSRLGADEDKNTHRLLASNVSIVVAQVNGSDVFRSLDGRDLGTVTNLDLRICRHTITEI